MKVLLTGGSGFLGKHLLERLMRDQVECVVLHRTASQFDVDQRSFPLFKFYNIETCSLADVFQQESAIDTIIHAATVYKSIDESCHQLLLGNVAFPLELLSLAVKHHIPCFINTDSFFNTPTARVYSHLADYTLSKRHFQEWGQFVAKQGKIKFLNARLFHMFGPGDGTTKFVPSIIRQCQVESEIRLTEGLQRRDFVFVSDVVEALLLLMNLPVEQLQAYQTFDIGTGQSISVKSFVEMVHALSKSQSQLKFGAIPTRPGEFLEAVADIEAMHRVGWRPKFSLEQGMQLTLDAFNNELKHQRLG